MKQFQIKYIEFGSWRIYLHKIDFNSFYECNLPIPQTTCKCAIYFSNTHTGIIILLSVPRDHNYPCEYCVYVC